MKKIEILAPAGNQEALAAAVESGADAVYLGGSRFNARAFAGNFDNGALEKAVSFAHIRGVKVYITVNILLSDTELAEVIDYIRFLYYIGVDAIIVQDLALLKLSKNLFPGFAVHCSTQMTVHSLAGAKYLASLGADRIVASREMCLEEVRELVEKSGVEIEAFVHGALCVSYSGQCLMSSLIGGRSGNRGKCAQPCRRRYSLIGSNGEAAAGVMKDKYLLSTRDLNTYNRLEEIASAGIQSLKIEGRMKKPEYVAIVVKHYKEAVEGLQRKAEGNVPKSVGYELSCAFNREFTEGYLFGKRNKEIVSIDRPDNRGVPIGHVMAQKGNMLTIRLDENYLNDGDGIEIISKDGRSAGAVISGIRLKGATVKQAEKGQTVEVFFKDRVDPGARVNKTLDSMLESKARESYFSENSRKIYIAARMTIHTDEHPVLEITDQDGSTVRYTAGIRVEKAEKAAASKERIIEQLKKTGDTPFVMDTIDVTLDAESFVPLKVVNEMRREALKKLTEVRSESWYRQVLQIQPISALKLHYMQESHKNAEKQEYIAAVADALSAEKAILAGADVIYFRYPTDEGTADSLVSHLVEMHESSGKGLYLLLPSITRDKENEDLYQRLKKLSHYLRNGQLGVVLSNLGQNDLIQKYEVQHHRVNFTLNIYNAVAAGHFFRAGAECVCLSPELNLNQIAALHQNCPYPMETLVYGHVPIMTTEYCPLSLNDEGCTQRSLCHKGHYGLKDEKGMIFPLYKSQGCRMQILNSQKLVLVEDLHKIIRSGVRKLRMDFYMENPKEVFEVVRLYRQHDGLSPEDQENLNRLKDKGFTKGHFFRGVD